MVQGIQLAVVSDSRLFREAMSFRLALEGEVELVDTVVTVDELYRSAPRRPIDVVLAYSSMERTGMAETVWDIKVALPQARVIVVGFEQEEFEVVRCIEAGASAWIEHNASYAMFLQTIRAVYEGQTACSPGILARVIRRIDELAEVRPETGQHEPKRLSFRETEVARLVALGMINKQIARRLGIKPPTVKNHVHSILQKLQVKRRRDVRRRLHEQGAYEDGWPTTEANRNG